MRDFYVFKRSNKKNYYVQFKNLVTGKLNSARSTGKENYYEAIQEASRIFYTQKQSNFVTSIKNAMQEHSLTQEDLLQLQSLFSVTAGTIPSPLVQSPIAQEQTLSTPFLQWLKDFWNYETSEYVQDKLSHGKKISKRYCYDQEKIIRYWEEYFSPEIILETLTVKDLESFEKYLWAKKITKKRTVVDELTGKKRIDSYTTQLSTITRNNIMKCASIAFE